MSTQAIIGYGAKFKKGDGASPEVFTSIAEVRKIGDLGSDRGLIDVTNLDSPDEFMEYLLGMKDGVEMTLEVNFLPADATQGYSTGLIEDHNNGTRSNYELVLPTGFGVFSFPALVKTWKAPVDPKAANIATFTLKVTGLIAWVTN